MKVRLFFLYRRRFEVRSLSIEDCRDLVEAKADLTIQDGRGYTPLHNAVRWDLGVKDGLLSGA